MPWTDEEWAILQQCQDQAGRGYAAHARVWSNHSLRYEPTLCDDCRKKMSDAALERARVWKPGDPCFTCGSTATVNITDGALLVGAKCNGCGQSDWNDD